MQQPIEWNQAYERGKDYATLTTLQLTELIHMLPDDLGKRHLDIGCGTGQLNRDMFHRGYQTIGIDTSDIAIKTADDSIDANNQLICFQVGDVFGINERQFDLITCKYVYTFIDNKDIFLKKVSELIGDWGVFVIIDPNILMLSDDKKPIALTAEDVSSQLSRYFDVKIVNKSKDVYYVCRERIA